MLLSFLIFCSCEKSGDHEASALHIAKTRIGETDEGHILTSRRTKFQGVTTSFVTVDRACFCQRNLHVHVTAALRHRKFNLCVIFLFFNFLKNGAEMLIDKFF